MGILVRRHLYFRRSPDRRNTRQHTNCVLLYDKWSHTRMFVTFGICFKQHLDTSYLAFCNPSPPRMFLPLDLLSEYRIQHCAIGPLYVTSSYSTWIFYTGGFRLYNCLCLRRLVSWINHLPPVCLSTFWKSTFKQQLGCRFYIMDCKSLFLYFGICNCICLNTSYDLSSVSFLNCVLYFY